MTKVLKLTIELDEYEKLAEYGALNVDERLSIEPNILNLRRFEGLERMAFTLRQLMGNVRFSMKKEGFKTLDILTDRLTNVRNTIPHVFKTYEDEITHEPIIEMNEGLFKDCLKILQSIKDTLNIPMNQAGLVFKQSDEMDIEAMMKEIAEGG